MGWFQVSFTPAIPARDAGEDAGQAETAPDAALAPEDKPWMKGKMDRARSAPSPADTKCL